MAAGTKPLHLSAGPHPCRRKIQAVSWPALSVSGIASPPPWWEQPLCLSDADDAMTLPQ
ncbi:MAG: hypothetical protein ACK583_11750 [Cyanobacteriota bacterium]